jgi:hypothetical protein
LINNAIKTLQGKNMAKPGFLFVFGAIAVILLSCPFTAPAKPPAGADLPPLPPGQGEAPLPNQSINSTPAETMEKVWLMIGKDNVEALCLSKAKEEAVAMGYSDSLVFGCACTAQELESTKAYDCKISALDGEHSVSVMCAKAQKTCAIVSEQGTTASTFEDLAAFVGQASAK